MGRAGAGDVHAGSLPRRELNVHPRALPAVISRPALAAFTPWNIARVHRYYESPALWKTADLVRHLVNSNFLYWVRGQQKSRQVAAGESLRLAGPTGLEPATSGVTGRRSKAKAPPAIPRMPAWVESLVRPVAQTLSARAG